MEAFNLPPTNRNFWSKNRLKTFENWPFQSQASCNPENMAAAGFIAIGNKEEPDLAECIFCFKQLDGWESTDNPWNEHTRHQTKCPYVALNKQDEMTWTIEEACQLAKEYYVQNLVREKEKALHESKKITAECKNEIPAMVKNNASKKKLSNAH